MTTTTKNKPASATTPATKAAHAKASAKTKASKKSKPENTTASALATLRADAVAMLARIDETIKETDAEEQTAMLADVENLADAIAGNANDIADGIEV